MSSNHEMPAAMPTEMQSRMSLATRLTMWYAGTAFVIALIAIGSLYVLLERSLEKEARLTLLDRLQDVQLVLRSSRGGSTTDLQDEFAEEASDRREVPIFYRVLEFDGTPHSETAGLSGVIDPEILPLPGRDDDSPQVIALHGVNEVPFRATAVRVPGTGNSQEEMVVQAAMDVSWMEKLLQSYRQRLWIALAGVLIASVIGGYEIARRGMRPIREIAQTARRVGSDALAPRLAAAEMPGEVASVAHEFNAMLERLKFSFDRLERFSADIAHELRTPVNNIRSATQIVLSRPRSGDEYRDTIENISEELDRLIRIIESLLFLARAEDPKHRIRTERLNLAHELQIVREFYEIAASEAGVSLRVESPQVEANLDRTLFQRAVGNLIQNAIVHTPQGGSVTLRAARANGHLEVSVRDSGCGVEQKHLPHLFDRLYRVDADRSTKLGGAGLGLAIVKSIVHSHGGSVDIASEVGKGTCVTLQFPLVPGEEKERASESGDRASVE